MIETVEIYSATDPVYFADRQVWYWVEFRGMKSERVTDWSTVDGHAKAILAEHEACLVDRSDKGSGFLLSTFG
jgi:hypothetical protein